MAATATARVGGESHPGTVWVRICEGGSVQNGTESYGPRAAVRMSLDEAQHLFDAGAAVPAPTGVPDWGMVPVGPGFCGPGRAQCSDAVGVAKYEGDRKACCRAIVSELVRYVGGVLGECHVTWWADYGTLLGAVRHGGMIPWDKDADFSIFAAHLDRVVLLEHSARAAGLGFTVTPNGTIEIRCSPVNHTHVDLFAWHTRAGGMLYRKQYASVDQFKGKEFPKAWLLPLVKVHYDGMEIPAPAAVFHPATPVPPDVPLFDERARHGSLFLEHRYGPEWFLPVRADNDGVVRGDANRVFTRPTVHAQKVSFCVHSFDEGAALRRLVVSSLPLADLIDEWVIVDHRSTDDTPEVIQELRSILDSHGIALRTWREERDLSATYTFADIRNDTIKACRNPIVVLHDADFVLGPAFRDILDQAIPALSDRRQAFHAATYAVPVLWDRVNTDEQGTLVDHGRVWVHPHRPRVLLRDSVHYEQIGNDGRWEKLVHDAAHPQALHLTPRKAPKPSAVVSINAKSPEKIALRDTMTMFMEDVVSGKVTGEWLENYREGRTRSQGEYPYVKADLRGWKLYLPGLEVATV